MRNIHYAILIVAFITGTLTGYSQINKFKGYVISLSGDSIPAYFKKNYWHVPPKKIDVVVNQKNISYGVDDIKGFGINGSEVYKSVVIRYFKDLYAGENLKNEFAESKSEERVFAKILQTGIVSLFSYQTSDRKYFFISENSGELIELVFRARLQGTVIIEDESYKEQLMQLFRKYNELKAEKAMKISYSEESIGRIVEKINQARDPGYKAIRKKNLFDFEVGATALYNSFPSAFTNLQSPPVKLSPFFTFSPQLNLTYKFKNNMGRFQIGLSVQYNFINRKQSFYDSSFVTVSPNFYYSEVHKHEYKIPSGYYMMNLYLQGYANRFGKLKLFAKAGASFNGFTGEASLKGKYSNVESGIRNGTTPFLFTIENNDNLFDFPELWIQPNAGIGLTFLRHSFEVLYYLPITIDRDLNNDNKFVISSVQGTYRYRISKSRR